MTQEQRYRIAARDFFSCQKCGKAVGTNGQVAHRIKQGKGSEKYIQNYLIQNYEIFKKLSWIRENIIDNGMNVVYCCSLQCNDSFNIFNKPVERDELLEKIIKKVV
jgi:hypothetical protein